MLKKIEVKNFKSLKKVEMNLNNLTLLTGINSTGKSSIIQSILLIKQNLEILNPLYRETNFDSVKNLLKNFKINGKYTDFGTNSNILYEYADNEIIEVKIELEKGEIFFEGKIEHKDSEVLRANTENKGEISELFETKNFTYLSAERISPKSIYEYSKENIDDSNLGKKGEYTIHYLAEFKNKDIGIEDLKHSGANTCQLLENVQCWLSEISSGISLYPEINSEVKTSSLKYSYGSKKMLPQNVGFGITYVLPIIVALLKAKKGDCIIIENPESHLHPSGQVSIARLCAKASQLGVQIIVETHSDHFFNGVRVAIKERKIDNSKVSMYYFYKKNRDSFFSEDSSSIEEIEVNDDGKINKWPVGFFDEWDIQLEKLLW